MSIEDAHAKLEAWRVDYNQRRLYSSLGHLALTEFVAQRQALRTVNDCRDFWLRTVPKRGRPHVHDLAIAASHTNLGFPFPQVDRNMFHGWPPSSVP